MSKIDKTVLATEPLTDQDRETLTVVQQDNKTRAHRRKVDLYLGQFRVKAEQHPELKEALLKRLDELWDEASETWKPKVAAAYMAISGGSNLFMKKVADGKAANPAAPVELTLAELGIDVIDEDAIEDGSDDKQDSRTEWLEAGSASARARRKAANA